MRIAIVGTGISGLSAAWLLNRRHNVTVFEATSRLGGHTNTVDVELAGSEVSVDTGFIVYNERNYPLLSELFAHLSVPTQPSSMTFAASVDDGALEYAGTSLSTLLAQPANAFRPGFLRMLGDVVRFNRLGLRHLEEPPAEEPSLRGFLDRHGLGRQLRDWYLLPMAAAIWSAPCSRILDYPARSLLRFFANHGLLQTRGHRLWRTVTGGARAYVDRIAGELGPRVRLGTRIDGVRRSPLGVELRDGRGETYRFDQVVLATHADQSLAMLEDATERERRLLGAFSFERNLAVLHQDPALMPRRRRVWSSWNYMGTRGQDGTSRVSVTYWMNHLQSLRTERPLLVSLNPLREPEKGTIHGEFAYAHPVMDMSAMAAQARMGEIQGEGGVWHAGAWLGQGFHEDGLRSGFAAARALGVVPPWERPLEPQGSAAMGLPEGAAAQPA